MMQEHIHSLLFENDCVIIPDFGGLITHYEPARIHPVKHTFAPPSKRIAFNEKLKMNDGLLISTFAYSNRISAEEAQKQVAEFVRQLNEELHTSQRYELKGVGIFRLNAERKLEFDYVPGNNFLPDGFGLPELLAQPILVADVTAGLRTLLKEKQKEDTVATSNRLTLRKRVKRVYDLAAVIAITGLSISALYFLSLQTDYSLSSLNPFSLYNISSAKVATVTAEPTFKNIEAPLATEEEPLAEQESEINAFAPEPEINPATEAGPIATEAETLVETKTVTAPVTAPAPAKTEKLPEAKKVTTVKPIVKPEVKAPAKAIESEKKTTFAAKATRSTIEAGSNRFYIIAGGFAKMKNAEWCQRQVQAKGATGKIIMPFMDSPSIG